jgi:hypothetical protein
MELANKGYKANKTKNYIKTKNFYFFFNGLNQNSQDWLNTEQSLKKMDLAYYKVFNKITLNIFKESIFNNVQPTVNGITMFMSLHENNKKILTKKKINRIDKLFFTLIAAKLNNKIYAGTLYKTIYSKEYIENKLVFYKFMDIHLKITF